MLDDFETTCDRMCRYCNNAYHKCPESQSFQSTDFLISATKLRKDLEDFASRIQEAVKYPK